MADPPQPTADHGAVRGRARAGVTPHGGTPDGGTPDGGGIAGGPSDGGTPNAGTPSTASTPAQRQDSSEQADLKTTGLKGDKLEVKAGVLRSDRCSELVALRRLQRFFSASPHANQDSFVANVWVAQPSAPGRYFIRVRVSKQSQAVFATRDSNQLFAVSRPRGLTRVEPTTHNHC